jgi:hypothetical protein
MTETAKELQQIGSTDKLEDHLLPYSKEMIQKIRDEKTQLVTREEFLQVHKEKLSSERMAAGFQEELESCIQSLITISIIANGDENIVIGNFVDSKLSKLAKTHQNVTDYIERTTGKNIDVVLPENTTLAAPEGSGDE